MARFRDASGVMTDVADLRRLVAAVRAGEKCEKALKHARKHHNADIMCPKASSADAECYCGADEENEDIDPALAAWAEASR